MDSTFYWCAVIGGGILVVQTLLQLLGFIELDADLDAGDVDVSEAGHGNALFQALSLQTLVAFATFFGLGGILARQQGLSELVSAVLAVAAGSLAFTIVAYLVTLMRRLHSHGNVDLSNALGTTAKVYLKIPGQHRGRGKVTARIQDRSFECSAVTAGDEIPTGAEVQIVSVRPPRTVEVVPVQES